MKKIIEYISIQSVKSNKPEFVNVWIIREDQKPREYLNVTRKRAELILRLVDNYQWKRISSRNLWYSLNYIDYLRMRK